MATYEPENVKNTLTSSSIAAPHGHTDLNANMKPRLIEEYFPTDILSLGGVAERYNRGKTPHTVFTWWARRPFAAMRGVIATSLIKSDDRNPGVQSTVEAYCADPEHVSARESIKHSIGPEPQRVLDVFAGGATIPIEAAAIGAHAYAMENNELAHFIQLSLLRLSQSHPNLLALVEHHGKSLLNRLSKETADFFPNRGNSQGDRTIAYFWSRSMRCPSCSASLSLLKRPWLSKKKNKSIFLQRAPDYTNKCFTRKLATSGEPTDSGSAWHGRVIKCPFCGHMVDRERIGPVLETHAHDELTAYCTSPGRGKKFVACEDSAQLTPSDEWLKEQIRADLALLGKALPEASLPRWSGITNPTLYGIQKISDLFNTRQLAVLVKCCRLLHDEYHICAGVHGTQTATAVTSFLSGLIDQLVDWNGRICMWISQNEQVGRGYSGPGIPMMWDFVEIDPVEKGPANLWDKLERILAGLGSVPQFAFLPEVVKGDARRLPFPDQYFDVVATDPPYFDNLYYNILADCIYVWKKLALDDILPDVFSARSTDEERELSVSKYRHGTHADATKFYTDGMTQVLSEIQRVLKADGVLAFIFAHSTVDGWTSIVEAFRRSHLDMVAAWEMQVERKHRPRGMRSVAVNTSFVLVGKKHHGQWGEASWPEFESRMTHRLIMERDRLLPTGWSDDDVGRSIFGSAVCAYSRAGNVYEDGRVLSSQQVLERLAKQVESMIPSFSIARR